MLRDVNTIVSDGLLGFATAKGDGLSIKLGSSPVEAAAPIIITGDMTAAQIRQRLGLSPLADAAMDSVQFGANRLYCIPVKGSVEGTISEITKAVTGLGSLTAAGAPNNAFNIIVKITAQGGFNTAAFAYSIDGGFSFSDERTVPLDGAFEIPGTGVTLTFAEADTPEDKPQSFVPDDVYSLTTTAPAMTNGEALAAVDKIAQLTQECEFVHIVGASELTLWQAISAAQQELMTQHKKPLFFVMEATMPEGEDLTDWALQMEADRRKIKNTDIQVCTAWGKLKRLDGITQDVNLAAVASGMYARAAVHVSIGKTQTAAGFGIAETILPELLPAALHNGIIEILDLAGYLTFRRYDGLDDTYVYHTKMMCPDGSDYRYAEDVRVKNKIIREIRKAGLQLLNDDIDLSDIQGELETRAKFMYTPVQSMIDAGEISDAEITVPEGQAETFLETETMRVRVRYLSRGYIREIEVDIGRSAISS